MPTTIYDSFIITQRSQNKTIADSFINRIQSQTNPTTGSAPALGITSASIINSVEEGQIKDIRKNFGCTTINTGCPCTVVLPSGTTINNVAVFPGAPSGVTASYGSVIITWTAPTIGVEVQPFTYELTTTPATLTNTILNGITTYTYTTPLAPLIPNTNYTFNVRAINSVGTGPFASSVGNFYAPYPAPTNILTPSQNIQFNGVDIAFDNYIIYFSPIPASSTLYTDQGNFPGTIYTPGIGFGSSLTVMGLSPSTTYTNCYIVLINGTQRSDKSATFSFSTPASPPAPQNVVQNVGSMGFGLALIDLDFYSYYDPPAICTLTIPTQGTYSPSIYSNNSPTSSANFNGLPSGTWNNCTLTLGWGGIDGVTVTTPSSITFQLFVM